MLFDIFFSGRMVEGADTQRVRENLAAIFKTDGEGVSKLCAGHPTRIKTGVDETTAVHYRTTFLKAGALIDIRPSEGSQAVSVDAAPTESATSPGDLSLLPPNTGSLADCAPRTPTAKIGDISGIGLAPVGVSLDESPPAPSPEIDTRNLSLAPSGMGTLEDCRVEKEAAKIPDISRIKLAKDERDR